MGALKILEHNYTPEMIKSIRGWHNLNQFEFGEKLGISGHSIRKLESGNLAINPNIQNSLAEFEKNNPVVFDNLKDSLIKHRQGNLKTQHEIADYLDMERNAYAQYEFGSIAPGTDKLTKLSKLYKVNPKIFTKLLPPDKFARELNNDNRPEITKLQDKLIKSYEMIIERDNEIKELYKQLLVKKWK